MLPELIEHFVQDRMTNKGIHRKIHEAIEEHVAILTMVKKLTTKMICSRLKSFCLYKDDEHRKRGKMR